MSDSLAWALRAAALCCACIACVALPFAAIAQSNPAAPPPAVALPSARPAPVPVPFNDAIERAGEALFNQAQARLGDEPRTLVIDPLIDAATGAQTRSTETMGTQLEAMVRWRYVDWTVQPLTRESLAARPLLLIGTLTAVNAEALADAPPNAFRIWLTLIDLRTGRIVAKQLDRATLDSVDARPLAFYQDSPTWHKDRTVAAYIASCQVDTKIGDAADAEYLARLPAAAVVNEATLAYGDGKLKAANQLYRQAQPLADAHDLRVLNGLYLTHWRLGDIDAARAAFDAIVDAGLGRRQLALKLLFEPGRTAFIRSADLARQYPLWIASLARGVARASSCVRVVGHTSRTGAVVANEVLSRRRADAVERLLTRADRGLTARLSASGVGAKEPLIGLGTDDQRDALDRRVEFRVVECD